MMRDGYERFTYRRQVRPCGLSEAAVPNSHARGSRRPMLRGVAFEQRDIVLARERNELLAR